MFQAVDVNLNENFVSHIPEDLAKCPRLSILRLQSNQLSLNSIPESLLSDSKVNEAVKTCAYRGRLPFYRLHYRFRVNKMHVVLFLGVSHFVGGQQVRSRCHKNFGRVRVLRREILQFTRRFVYILACIHLCDDESKH